MIKIGEYEIGRDEISIALMIMFAMAAMFFIGYKYAYDKAISYANEQITELTEDIQMKYGIIKEQKFDYPVIKIPGGVGDGEG